MSLAILGLGLGGVFYVSCALLMLVREVGRAVRHPRSPRRWKTIRGPVGIALGIVLAVGAAVWALIEFGSPPPALGHALLPGPAWASWVQVPLAVLALLIGVAWLQALLLRGQAEDPLPDAGPPRSEGRPAHRAAAAHGQPLPPERVQPEIGSPAGARVADPARAQSAFSVADISHHQ